MNKYEKLAVIGRGAHGTVYLAQRIASDDPTQHKVIIKEIPVDGMTLAQRQNALGEAKVLQLLSHPNIIGYYEYFVEHNSLYIVMQYAEGGTMAEYLSSRKGRPLEEWRVMRLFTQILLALHHVHGKCIVHRDMKTQNILLNRAKDIAKLSDFGISKELVSQSKATTVIGTPYYLSPEVVNGRSYNQKSDIWALGCILYEMVTLRRAFDADTMPALFDKICTSAPDALQDHVSAELVQVIGWCLDRDPAKRPDTAQLLTHPHVLMGALSACTDMGTLPCTAPRPGQLRDPTTPTTGRKLKTGNADRSTLSPLSALSCLAGLYRLCLINKQTVIDLDVPGAHPEINQVATNGVQHFGVTETGTLIHWTGDDVFAHSPSPTRLSHGLSLNVGLQCHYLSTNVVTVAVGDSFYLMVNDEGMLMSAGQSVHGCLGLGASCTKADSPQVVSGLMDAAVTHIACGHSHVLALTDDNHLFAWGKTNNGRLGLPDTDGGCVYEPTQVELPACTAQIHGVYCSLDASAVLLADGTLWATGSNMFNKLCANTTSRCVSHVTTFGQCAVPPVNVELPQPVSLGLNHLAIISGHKVHLAGNACGSTAVKSHTTQAARPLAQLESRAARVMAGNNCTFIVTADQKLWKYADESLQAVDIPDADAKREVVSAHVSDQTLIVVIKCDSAMEDEATQLPAVFLPVDDIIVNSGLVNNGELDQNGIPLYDLARKFFRWLEEQNDMVPEDELPDVL